MQAHVVRRAAEASGFWSRQLHQTDADHLLKVTDECWDITSSITFAIARTKNGTRHPWNHPLNHLLNHLLNRLNLAPTWLTCSKARRLSGPLSWNPAKKKPSREQPKTIAQESAAIWFFTFWCRSATFLNYQMTLFRAERESKNNIMLSGRVRWNRPQHKSLISFVVSVFDNGLQPWIFSRWHF